jgi:hypothetical protein
MPFIEFQFTRKSSKSTKYILFSRIRSRPSWKVESGSGSASTATLHAIEDFK